MLQQLFQQLHTWSRLRDATDSRLLEQFFTRRDESAFSLLVRRHGPMVLGVCRRLLREPQDVEDAFQATFLVLVRRGRSLPGSTVLGAWLHGVAWRCAKKAQTMIARRISRVQTLAEERAKNSASTAEAHELRTVLDEELALLPAKVRCAVVTCYLEGHSKSETARILGWPEGTVATRLAWAKNRLRTRLTRRGITLGATLAGVETGLSSLAEAVTFSLEQKTVAAAAQALAGPWAATAAISATAFRLAEGVLATMNAISLKNVLILAASTLVLGTGVGWWGIGPGLGRAATVRERESAADSAEQDPAPPKAGEQKEDLAKRLRGDWVVTKVEARQQDNEPWTEGNRPSGWLHVSELLELDQTSGFANFNLSMGLRPVRSYYRTEAIPGQPNQLRLLIQDARLPLQENKQGEPTWQKWLARFEEDKLILEWQESARQVRHGFKPIHYRNTFRRGTDLEILEGGWTAGAVNEVTRQLSVEQILVFRGDKYVAIYRDYRLGRFQESDPTGFELNETPKGKVISFRILRPPTAIFSVLDIMKLSPWYPTQLGQQISVPAAYKLRWDELALAFFHDYKRHDRGEVPSPFPTDETEAAKMGATLVRFGRGYRRQDGSGGPRNIPSRPTAPLTPAPPTQPAAEPAAEPPADLLQQPSVRALTEKMRDALNDIFRNVDQADQVPGSYFGNARTLMHYSRLLCEAELDLATDMASRINVFEAHVARTKKLEERAKARFNAGQIRNTDLMELTYHRLEAERRLELEKLKAKKLGGEKE